MGGDANPGEPFDDMLSLRAILGRIRGELVELGRCADGLQVTIGVIAANSAAPLSASAQMELQAADALSQRLERLADLADVLQAGIQDGRTFDPDPKSGADLAHALSRLTGAGALPKDVALSDEDDCEMF